MNGIIQVLMHVYVCLCTQMTRKQKQYSLIKTLLHPCHQWLLWISFSYTVHVVNNAYMCVFLGCMEDGTALGDVELPPWAKGDPQEFIRIHREVSDT